MGEGKQVGKAQKVPTIEVTEKVILQHYTCPSFFTFHDHSRPLIYNIFSRHRKHNCEQFDDPVSNTTSWLVWIYIFTQQYLLFLFSARVEADPSEVNGARHQAHCRCTHVSFSNGESRLFRCQLFAVDASVERRSRKGKSRQ